eukprot:5881132-Pyramimonas_sp.AAC.1
MSLLETQASLLAWHFAPPVRRKCRAVLGRRNVPLNFDLRGWHTSSWGSRSPPPSMQVHLPKSKEKEALVPASGPAGLKKTANRRKRCPGGAG